jgi:hypothetical protein
MRGGSRRETASVSEHLTDVRYAPSGEVYIAYPVAGAVRVDIVQVEGY